MAVRHPERVTAMILRGIFLLTRAELRWFYQDGCSWLFPEAFAEFLSASAPVLHWHGDTFDLPAGARRLSSSDKYPNQAFAIDDFALGLQFHIEVTAKGLERWYVGHACELAQSKIDVRVLRSLGEVHAGALEAAARRFFRRWLNETFAAGVAPRSREVAQC